MKRLELTAIDWAAPIEQECCVPVELTDSKHWEVEKQSAGQFMVAQAVNGVHFYRVLPNRSESLPSIMETEPRFIAFVGQDHREGYLQALEPLRGAYLDHSPASLNAPDLLEAIAGGVDALFLIAHGHSEQGIVFRADERGSLGLAELENALASNPRPLRFASFMLCDLQKPLLNMLGRLAEAGKLHPHFGGIVMWGEPRVEFGVPFTQLLVETLINNPDPQYPLLKAVQHARVSLVKTYRAEVIKPVVVAFHPHANPLPNATGQALEQYLQQLAAPDWVTRL